MPDETSGPESRDTGTTRRRVVIVGGGLAGLAAASALASRGVAVTVLESRPRLGGRASSIMDRDTGETIDNCQHVAMGCCTSFRHFCEEVGCSDLFETQPELYFVGPPAPPESSVQPEIVRFHASLLPAPLHLASSFLRMPWFSVTEKRQIALGLRALAMDQSTTDRSFQEWLDGQRQPKAVQRRFWHLVLVSALSESLDRISFQHARKVFIDGFLASREGWQVSIPTVPLDDVYENRIAASLRNAGVEIRTKAGVRTLLTSEGRVTGVELRDGSQVSGDDFVLAVPHYLVAAMLPADVAQLQPVVALNQLETAPIASVHLWYDQPLTELPHATFVDRLSQWMFNRTVLSTGSAIKGSKVRVAGGRALASPQNCELGARQGSTASHPIQNSSPSFVGRVVSDVRAAPARDGTEDAGREAGCRLQVVISAARDLSAMSEQDVISQVDAELREVWPERRDARLIHGRMITEHRAVFSPLPGVDEIRPAQQSPIPNLQFAGDWTRTGWPATMEGAVRSGYLAAENVLSRRGQPEKIVPPDLPTARLYRLLFS